MIPGLWRLRLPLPFPGVPHCNAWAVAADGGIVLFDTGMHEPAVRRDRPCVAVGHPGVRQR